MHKSLAPLLLSIILVDSTTNALNISVEKSKSAGGGTYYRFWFVYACMATVVTVILIIFTTVSMCRRYKLVASQEEEISEIH